MNIMTIGMTDDARYSNEMTQSPRLITMDRNRSNS